MGLITEVVTSTDDAVCRDLLCNKQQSESFINSGYPAQTGIPQEHHDGLGVDARKYVSILIRELMDSTYLLGVNTHNVQDYTRPWL